MAVTVEQRARAKLPLRLGLGLLAVQGVRAVAGVRIGGPVEPLADALLQTAIFLLAAGAVLREARPAGSERRAWTIVAIGLLAMAAGQALEGTSEWWTAGAPAADVLRCVLYACLYVALVRIARLWTGVDEVAIDAALAALALAAVAARWLVGPLMAGHRDGPAAVVTHVVFPLADLGTVAFASWICVVGGSSRDTMWRAWCGLAALALTADALGIVATTDGPRRVAALSGPAIALGIGVLPSLARAEPAEAPASAADRRFTLAIPTTASLVGIVALAVPAIRHERTLGPALIAAVLLLSALARTVGLTLTARRLGRAAQATSARLTDAMALAGLVSIEFDFARQTGRWSPEAARMHGLDEHAVQLDGATLGLLVHPQDRERVAAAIAQAQDREGPVQQEYRIVRPDGEALVLELRGHVSGDVLHASVQDVTMRRYAEERLRRDEARYRLVLENAQDGIWIVDRDRLTVFVNARMCELLGVAATDVLGRRPSEFVGETSDGRPLLEHHIRHIEARFLRPDGALVWASVSASPNDAWAGGWAMVVTDITSRRLLEEELRRAATEDELTGLPNRRAFEELVDGSDPAGGRAVALLDIDHFKFVNDSFGHVIGDELVRHVAAVLFQALGDDGTLARFGGDEFAVVLPGADSERAEAVIERLLGAVREAGWRSAGSVTASAGLAIASPACACAKDLLRAADIALFEAKDAGRDRCVTYRGPHGGLAWVDEVRAAIDEERLLLFSQAIVPLNGGAPREELLVRMLGRDGEFIQPAAFIPTAEQFGLAYRIDSWVLERAIELAAAGRAIEMNISAATVGDQRIVARLRNAVHAGVDPSLLTFEITETAAFRNLDTALRFAHAVTALGAGVAIDDFGTGYGSMTYLRRLPVTQIKIDIDFVRNLTRDAEDARIVRAIIDMAASLGLETVAEGVEDPEAVDVLREMGADFAQGFAIERPRPVETRLSTPARAAAVIARRAGA